MDVRYVEDHCRRGAAAKYKLQCTLPRMELHCAVSCHVKTSLGLSLRCELEATPPSSTRTLEAQLDDLGGNVKL